MKREEREQLRVAASRERFEARLGDLQRSISREIGRPLDLKVWALPLVALAIGVSFGVGALVRGRRRRLGAADDDDS